MSGGGCYGLLKSIRRDQVKLGMFIHGFEGSWLDHPFWRRRFLLDRPAQLTAVLDSDVAGVVIDTDKGADLVQTARAPDEPGARYQSPQRFSKPRSHRAPIRDASGDRVAHAEALRVVNRSKRVMIDVLDGARLGQAVRSAAVVAVVEDVSAAVQKNRRALLKVLRLKSKDEYTYVHSVAVCALMIALARQLGLDDDITADLGTAGLLHDIGKMAVPLNVLNKPAQLTDEEFALVQTHPEKGFRLLELTRELPPVALEVCRHHHEKVDGTGYPHGLSGDEISLGARMGAICDVYDALTSHRVYKAAWSPAEAISRMHEWEGQFDRTLMLAFMKMVGVFPPGMIVELRTNRLGLVINCDRTSRHKVVAFYSTVERELIEPVEVVLGEDLAHDAVLAETSLHRWSIDPAIITGIQQRYT